MICRKIGLIRTDHVLNIGCGWGGFAKYAAEHFSCKVTWEYSLLSGAGAFRARAIQVWQIVMTHAAGGALHPRCRPIRCRP
jgi:cyclopropane fatty-acyl-phospholipid synthase-like methyltransferase